MEWGLLPLRRYAEFSGRSRRKEFWMFVLLSFIAAIVAGVIDISLGYGTTDSYVSDSGFGASATSSGPVGIILTLALLIPGIAVSVRRLHDTDRSGWWLLLAFLPLIGAIVLVVFYCLDGTRGPNEYGPDPVGEGSPTT